MDDRDFLEGIVGYPSPSGSEEEVATYLQQYMAWRGFRTGRDAAGNAWGEVGKAGARTLVVLLGHMDTVSGLIPVHWEGDLLYGRGAVDAKGPLAAFVLAAEQLATRLSDMRIRVVGAVEEERESRGAHHLVTQMRPDFCIIGEPSGWDGITVGYKGVLHVDYRRVQPVQHSASVQPSVGEQGVTFWSQVADLARRQSEGKSAFGALDASLRSIRTSGDGLADRVDLRMSLRVPPQLDVERLKDELRVLADGAEVSFPYAEPPIEVSKNSPLVRAFLKAIRAQGGQPRFKVKTGTADMNVVGPVWGCPIVAYGPGDSSLDHTPREHLSLEEFRRSVGVLVRVLQDLAAAS